MRASITEKQLLPPGTLVFRKVPTRREATWGFSLSLGLQPDLDQPADGFGARTLIVPLGRHACLGLRGHFGTSGLSGQYFDLVKIQFFASASVSKSPI
jgi:hypothetical protein